jgi:flavodoxin
MNPVVVYFSRTGNTKRLAHAIADFTKAKIFELTEAETAEIAVSDFFIFGTPVEGACPAKEAQTYIANLPTVAGKKTIIFCTYKIFGNERAMKTIEKELSAKGYETILKVSKKGMKPNQTTDFSEILSKIKAVILKKIKK